MDTTLLDAALTQGVWAAVAIFLLIYIVKANEKLNTKQAEREERYQELLQELTEKYEILSRIEEGVTEIKGKMTKHEENST